MASNSTASYRTSETQRLAWDLTLHRTLSAAIAALGTVINLTAILVIICRRLYQQKTFIFVLNFFIGNLLMSSLVLPLLFLFSFSSIQKIRFMCAIFGYAFFSLNANSTFNLSLISINRYIQIVRFNHYEKIFSIRNICIMLVFAWLYFPTFLVLPLTGVWGNFTLDPLRLLCHPLSAGDGFRRFAVGSLIVITAPISFCYISIIREAISSGKRVHTTHSGSRKRIKNEKQLIRSTLVMITLFSVMHMPIVVTFQIDPKMELISPWFHCLTLYLGSSMCLINGLAEFIINQKIKTSFLSIWKKIMKRNNHCSALGIKDTEMDATS